MNEGVLFAFLMTAFAGLSTGIGSAIALCARQTNKTFLSVALGFSAGVMTYVSFVEIFFKARTTLETVYSPVEAATATAAAFFAGMVFIAVIDRLVPSAENPHEPRQPLLACEPEKQDDAQLLRMGKFAALAIAIHNFPEGLATFISAMSDASIGIPITIAISLHNIPEGISVSVPIYYATGSRSKAFWYSLLSGVSEPFGALIGYFVLKPFFSPTVFGVIFASVAGIMVFISIDELFPTAKAYGKGHAAIYGLMAGMAVMAISLLLFM